ncbi:MAG TPA: PspC domain-containing protein [Mycobacteriales bacterium]|nr:PspC domain-containing protein [Mycobacteriales bacterium]
MTETPQGADEGGSGRAAGPTTTRAGAPPRPDHAPPPAPLLLRPARDRVFRGVCVAIGRATGTDPVLWRVLVVVLTVFGGGGLVLYLAGWLLIPEEGAPESDLQRLVRGQGGSPGATVAAVLLAVLALGLLLGDGGGIVPLAVVAGLAYLVLRQRESGARPDQPGPLSGAAAWDAPPAWTEPSWQQPSWDPVDPAAGGSAWGPPPGAAYGPVAPPAPAPPRSRLGLLTVSAVAVAVGGSLLLGAGAPAVVATALLVTGLGLVVGTVWGRSRGLVLLAAVLTVLLAATSSVDRDFGTTTGERTWLVDGPAQHRLGAGEAVLDLTDVDAGASPVTVTAAVGAGTLLVLVPQSLPVDVAARVRVGEVRFTDDGAVRASEGGLHLDRSERVGRRGGEAAVHLDVRVGLGQLEVRRVAAG